MIPLDVMIDLINEVSDTMILVYVNPAVSVHGVAAPGHDGDRYDAEGNGGGGGLQGNRRQVQEHHGCGGKAGSQ